MTKKYQQMLEERTMLNELIATINGRRDALKELLKFYDYEYKCVEKKLQKHLKKYAKELAIEDERESEEAAR